jgi:hypothetical protein
MLRVIRGKRMDLGHKQPSAVTFGPLVSGPWLTGLASGLTPANQLRVSRRWLTRSWCATSAELLVWRGVAKSLGPKRQDRQSSPTFFAAKFSELIFLGHEACEQN